MFRVGTSEKVSRQRFRMSTTCIFAEHSIFSYPVHGGKPLYTHLCSLCAMDVRFVAVHEKIVEWVCQLRLDDVFLQISAVPTPFRCNSEQSTAQMCSRMGYSPLTVKTFLYNIGSQFCEHCRCFY